MTNPKSYRALEPVYVDGVLYKTNEPFTTAAPANPDAWEAIGADDRTLANVSSEQPDDVDYTKFTPTELRAYLISQDRDPGNVKDKDKLLDMVHALDKPQL